MESSPNREPDHTMESSPNREPDHTMESSPNREPDLMCDPGEKPEPFMYSIRDPPTGKLGQATETDRTAESDRIMEPDHTTELDRTFEPDQLIDCPARSCWPVGEYVVRTPLGVEGSPDISVAGSNPLRLLSTKCAAASTFKLPAPAVSTPVETTKELVNCKTAFVSPG